MTPRPLISSSSRRPLSAIFIGSLPPKEPKELNIPDLPEPPESPGAVSTASGLPSPPATNSTGSGSTGDNNSANAGSTRQRPASYSSSSSSIMSTENYDKPTLIPKTLRSISDDEDDENDYANEEDDTARLDSRLVTKSPSENIVALQRVKSLAQRNRMALDKLSSFSRLNTPSPTNSSRASRSPLPPPSSSSSSAASSSRLSSHSHSHSAPQPRHNDTLSGSETERESLRAPTPSRSDSNSNSFRSSSPELSTTPPPIPDSRARQRRTSAPASPDKTRQASPGPSRTPRKRVSLASTMSAPGAESGRYGTIDHDVTDAALAAVASSRRSPTGTGSVNRRSRQPLPREFRGTERRSLDGRNSIEPMTPHRTPYRDGGYMANPDTSPRTAAHTAANANASLQYSPRGPRSTRSSTVRDLTRRHQTRWLSDDISNNTPDSGRRQAQRGGSAESALNGSSGAAGRLAGEGLRAAGIGMRGSMRHTAPIDDDVFGDDRDTNVSVRRSRSSATGSSTGRVVEWEDEQQERKLDADDRSRASTSGARVNEGVGPPAARPHLNSDPPRAPAVLVAERDTRGAGRIVSARPATSMAEFYHGEDGPRNGSYSIRSRRTTYDLSDRVPRDSPSMRPLSLQQIPPEPERSRTGTLTRRHTTMTPLGNGSVASLTNPQNAEHSRLMLDSLSMFQSQLSRLPNQTQTVRDLSDQSGAIIRASDRLNKLLRSATANAVQQQIAVEIDDDYDDQGGGSNPAQIWRDVGSDFRESLRESDDIVRSLTGFILGFGKLLKETAAGTTPDSGHLRTMSLDEEVTRRLPSDPGVERSNSKRSQDGRRSAESRLSWEQMASTGADVSRRLSSRGEVSLARPPSSSRDRESDQDRPIPSRNGMNPPPSATRRLFTPREQREQQITSNALAVHNTPSNVLDLSVEYEPSPTPASRYPQGDRPKPPAFSTPPPLPSLPSESLLRKSSSLLEKGNRRKVSMASITTVRAANAPFPLSTPNPTTAITAHTVSASPETSTFPLARTDSHDSIRSSVTFSRPSEVSLSALQQQQNRDDARRRVTPSASSAMEEDIQASSQMRSPLSGSETERDTRRRTIGSRAARMSLDSAIEEREGESGPSQPNTITLPSQRRQRRRTVTEIFG
ncbi:hypothetical protein HYDPIDRAFT_117468 [Hydnomerulius pinastri MD-312]|uniref:Uncharacterized protein n=1 Tax=Hydnomerulius pinastri MD-312 TaxID=994086 RepID=A0A0C9WAM1_9AGAM|nr:hypothetical protein HYDPIDRAFT_117468 [Hydnomerulius pinastri MD-312]